MSQKRGVRAKILEILISGKSFTTTELANQIRCSSSTAWSALDKLHKEKNIHICGWKRNFGTRGLWGAKWIIGPGKDSEKPKKNRKADSRRYYKKLDPMIKKLRWMKYRNRLNIWSGLK